MGRLMKLSDIIGELIRLGINLTDSQTKLLKWRLSDQAKQYYEEKENLEFYKALKSGDLSVVDAIRKEKQNRINKMKSLLPLIICLPLLSSCASDIPFIEKKWDVNSLLEKDKTYALDQESVKIKGKSDPIQFKGNWYIVSEDFVKTFNENQDTLIASLEKVKEINAKVERSNKVILYLFIPLFSIIILGFFFFFLFRLRKS